MASAPERSASTRSGPGDKFDRLLAKIDRFIAGPPPDRPTVATVEVTDPLDIPGADEEVTDEEATPVPTATPDPDADPVARARRERRADPRADAHPDAGPGPQARRRQHRQAPQAGLRVGDGQGPGARRPASRWSSPSSARSTHPRRPRTGSTSKVRQWESYSDSHNGDWGPAAMALALKAYGVPGYEIRAYNTRQGALRGAARAIEKTDAPVILLAWRGAHTWVMTGFRADADPSVFKDAKITGTYILDPWYPRVSSIWGPSDPPGTFQNESEMIRNYLQVEATRGPLPGPRRQVHHRGADHQGSSLTGHDRRSRATRKTGEQRVLGGHPDRVAERDRQHPRLGPTSSCEATTTTPRPANEAADLADGVVGGVQPARERVGERVERDRQGERGHDRRRPRDVLGVELAAAEQDARRARPTAGTSRSPTRIVRPPMTRMLRRRSETKTARSASA